MPKIIKQWEVILRVDAENDNGPFGPPDDWDWTQLVGKGTRCAGYSESTPRIEEDA